VDSNMGRWLMVETHDYRFCRVHQLSTKENKNPFKLFYGNVPHVKNLTNTNVVTSLHLYALDSLPFHTSQYLCLVVNNRLLIYKFNHQPHSNHSSKIHTLDQTFQDLPSFHNIKIHLQVDQICVKDTENFLNYDLITVFANSRIAKIDKGVHFEYRSPKLFCIPHNCIFSHLKEIMCVALGLLDQTTLKKSFSIVNLEVSIFICYNDLTIHKVNQIYRKKKYDF